jgi:hypothetical protein
MDRPTLQEQLDACRNVASPTDDPLLRELDAALKSDPQIAKQLANQLDADAQVRAELASVLVPSNLPEKLLLAFRQGSEQHQLDRTRNRDVAGQAVKSAAETDKAAAIVEQVKPVLSPRRRLPKKTIAGLITITAALLLVFAFRGRTSQLEVDWDSNKFAREAVRFCDEKNAIWQNLKSVPPPSLSWDSKALPLANTLQPLKWRELETSQPRDWIMWELNSNAGERVYVLATNAKWKTGLLPAVLSQTPTIPSSGTWSVGVFRKGDVSYAPIVEGNAARFRNFVRPPSYARSRFGPSKPVARKAV